MVFPVHYCVTLPTADVRAFPPERSLVWRVVELKPGDLRP